MPPAVIRWPDHYPQGCPPADAQEGNGDVFRLVRTDPPANTDFVSKYIEIPRKVWGGHECQSRGLSVFRVMADAVRLRDEVAGMRNRKIAKASITWGKIKLTTNEKKPDSHHTWWVPVDHNPLPLFQVIQVP